MNATGQHSGRQRCANFFDFEQGCLDWKMNHGWGQWHTKTRSIWAAILHFTLNGWIQGSNESRIKRNRTRWSKQQPGRDPQKYLTPFSPIKVWHTTISGSKIHFSEMLCAQSVQKWSIGEYLTEHALKHWTADRQESYLFKLKWHLIFFWYFFFYIMDPYNQENTNEQSFIEKKAKKKSNVTYATF